MPPIPDHLMGDVWPSALPGATDADYGIVTFDGAGPYTVRSVQTFTLVYTVGAYGLDDTGAIKMVTRWTHDGGPWQTHDADAHNYVSASASNNVHLDIECERYPHRRPWYNGLRLTVRRGFMRPGDTITLVLNMRLQTFPEEAFEFRVLADPCATGTFIPVASPHIAIIAGPPAKWVLTAPTLRAPGAKFALGLRAEDAWGNATVPPSAPLSLRADGPAAGLPKVVTPGPDRGTRIDGLTIPTEGTTHFTLHDAAGKLLARSNPMVTKADAQSYWGDLHGQSGETVGIDPMRSYLTFARDVAFLDVCSHQANDFQIKDAFWDQINDLSAEFNADGSFTMFPGYEWSGNTPVGGDHNVFFGAEGEPIHRSSRALLTDRTEMDADAPTLTHLFEHLQGRDAVVYAHIGGRPADISFAHDAQLRTAVEVHSDWGTFEWLMTDAFALGHRVGLVCNSDGHKGAPGACYPGASEFGAYSGLTCFLADGLTRQDIFAAMRARHHYGTTGCRMHLDVRADLGPKGHVWPEDPAWSGTPPRPATTAIMGDIAQATGNEVTLNIACHAHAPILSIDVLRGADVLHTHRPYTKDDLDARVRVTWHGAEYRGRGRQTYWTGNAALDGAVITRMQAINAWNLERQCTQTGPDSVAIDAVTTGNFSGIDLWLDTLIGTLKLGTPHASATIDLTALGIDPHIIDAGGLARELRITRLPERLTTSEAQITVPVPLNAGGDTPLWVRITTEDGFNAWSSPIYLLAL
ncbi:MAG: DUF3604 domain-containing protein [Pseudomonadota bacterium]